MACYNFSCSYLAFFVLYKECKQLLLDYSELLATYQYVTQMNCIINAAKFRVFICFVCSCIHCLLIYWSTIAIWHVLLIQLYAYLFTYK